MILAQKLETSVASELRKMHKVKRLNKAQKDDCDPKYRDYHCK